jgi:hypothetical protein
MRGIAIEHAAVAAASHTVVNVADSGVEDFQLFGRADEGNDLLRKSAALGFATPGDG